MGQGSSWYENLLAGMEKGSAGYNILHEALHGTPDKQTPELHGPGALISFEKEIMEDISREEITFNDDGSRINVPLATKTQERILVQL